MKINDVNTSHAGIVEQALQYLGLELCRQLGIQASHPNLDTIDLVLRRRLEAVYFLGLSGRDDLASERTNAGEAVYLRYLPAAGEPGESPVYGEVGPFVQHPRGQVR